MGVVNRVDVREAEVAADEERRARRRQAHDGPDPPWVPGEDLRVIVAFLVVEAWWCCRLLFVCCSTMVAAVTVYEI